MSGGWVWELPKVPSTPEDAPYGSWAPSASEGTFGGSETSTAMAEGRLMRANRPEDAIQHAVFQHLRAPASAGLVAIHVGNGGSGRAY